MNSQEKDCTDYVFLLSGFVSHYNSREDSKISHIFKKDGEYTNPETTMFSLELKSEAFNIEVHLPIDGLNIDLLSDEFLKAKNQFYGYALRHILKKTFKGK